MSFMRRAATGIVLVTLLAACSGDADTNDDAPPDTAVDTPPGEVLNIPDTGDPFEYRSPVVTDEPIDPPAEINESAPATDSEVAVQLVSYSSRAQSQQGWYWTEGVIEICHWYQATDGQWYRDLCLKHANDANGEPVSNLINLWRYYPDSGWQVVLNLWTGDPNFVMYRDLTDPVFNSVAWAAYPVGQYPTEHNTWLMQYGDNSWYTVAYFQALTQGTEYPLWVPAWDPSVTVWTHTTLFNVNNDIASIPSFF